MAADVAIAISTIKRDNPGWVIRTLKFKYYPYDEQKHRGRSQTRWPDDLKRAAGFGWVREAKNRKN